MQNAKTVILQFSLIEIDQHTNRRQCFLDANGLTEPYMEENNSIYENARTQKRALHWSFHEIISLFAEFFFFSKADSFSLVFDKTKSNTGSSLFFFFERAVASSLF